MEWLNYHHLYHFWMVAREGSIAAACDRLDVGQPTISTQIRALERALGAKLFDRRGRGLVLTDAGRVAYRYADEIFALGRELRDTIGGRHRDRALRLTVGAVDALPKLVVHRLLEPARRLEQEVRIACFEGKPEPLLADLAFHRLDLVLSDVPLGPNAPVRAYNHELGECGISILGVEALAAPRVDGFPRSLDGAPFLLPTGNTTLRRSLEPWFESHAIRPEVVGEFEDSALIKVFGQAGDGLFAVPTVIESRVCEQQGVRPVGRIDSIRERFFAISIERRLKHPAVVAISEAARRTLFH